ncbi:MAG: MFS transporter [Deferribacterales bacterium]
MYNDRRVTVRELVLLGSLYITQYLGFSFFIEALVAIMRKNGASLQSISVIYLLGFFWMLKFLWAPVIDRYSPVKRWKYKGWLLIFQFFLVVSLLITSGLTVGENMKALMLIGVFIGFISSTQDVVVDALAYGLLSERDRGIGNAVKISGGMLGYMIGGGAGLMLYAWLGWENCLWVLAFLTSVSFVQLIFFKEPVFRPHVIGGAGYAKYFFRFWLNGRLRWLLLLFFYPIGICIAYTLISPILVDSGWRLDVIGLVVNVIGSAVGAVSAFFAGMMIKKFGRRKMLVGLSLAQGATVLLMLLPVSGHSGTVTVLISVCMILIVYSPSATLLSTIMMDQVSGEKPATDFAMQHSFYLMVGFFSGFAGTAMAGVAGYVTMISIASMLAFLAAGAAAVLYRHPSDEEVRAVELKTVTEQ